MDITEQSPQVDSLAVLSLRMTEFTPSSQPSRHQAASIRRLLSTQRSMITPSLLPSRGLVFRTRLDGHTISNVNGVPTNATGASLTYATSQYGIQSQYGVFNGSSNYVDTSTLADSNTYDIYVRFRTASFATNQFLFFEGDTSGGADMSLQIT